MDYSAEESFKIKCSSSCNWSWQKCTIVLVVHSRDNDTDGTWFDIKDIQMIQLLIGTKQNFFGVKQSLSRYKQTSTAQQFIFVMCIQYQRWLIGTINNVCLCFTVSWLLINIVLIIFRPFSLMSLQWKRLMECASGTLRQLQLLKGTNARSALMEKTKKTMICFSFASFLEIYQN